MGWRGVKGAWQHDLWAGKKKRASGFISESPKVSKSSRKKVTRFIVSENKKLREESEYSLKFEYSPSWQRRKSAQLPETVQNCLQHFVEMVSEGCRVGALGGDVGGWGVVW